jgi:hypothetical protein
LYTEDLGNTVSSLELKGLMYRRFKIKQKLLFALPYLFLSDYHAVFVLGLVTWFLQLATAVIIADSPKEGNTFTCL